MRLLFLTGSRSDWGYIKPIIDICKKKKINHRLCVTNMLLLDSYGMGINEIKKEGYKVDEEIFMTLDGHNSFTTAKSMGVFIISFVDVIKKFKPDWVVLAGDRYETMAACIACAYTNTLISHIQAGELSGNIDGQARHAIGKFAHLHFASNLDAKKRLMKLGEENFRVKLVGAPQIDDITKLKKKSNIFPTIKKNYGLPYKRNYYLVMLHSVTEEIENTANNIKILVNSLNTLKEKKIWILPNNDPGSSIIKNYLIDQRDENNLIFENLPREHYLTLLKNCKCIIGNSSSGIIEASSFKVPTINLGRRQKNRYRPNSVIDIKNFDKSKILKSVKIINSEKFMKKINKIQNPYGNGNSSTKIINELVKMKNKKDILFKNLTY